MLNKGKVLFEFLLNVLSFAFLTFSQQVIIMPTISKYTTQNVFGEIVLLVSLSNIIVSSTGFSIGQARLLEEKSKIYSEKYILYLRGSYLITSIIFVCYYVFKNSYLPFVDYLIFIASLVFAEYRFFAVSEFRIQNNNKNILLQNLLYTVGSLIGILIYKFISIWPLIFLTAELASFIYTFCHINTSKFNVSKISIIKRVYQLCLNNGLSYSVMYIDRFVISQIFDTVTLSAYFASSVSSQIGYLLINPLSNYILGKFSYLDLKRENIKIKPFLFLSFLLGIFFFITSIILTPILIKLLYFQYYNQVIDIYVYVCGAASIMAGVAILKNIFLKYVSVSKYNILYLSYGIFLSGVSIVSSYYFSIKGFVISLLISNFLLYIILLKILNKKFSNNCGVTNE